jgi:hypothetical protein
MSEIVLVPTRLFAVVFHLPICEYKEFDNKVRLLLDTKSYCRCIVATESMEKVNVINKEDMLLCRIVDTVYVSRPHPYRYSYIIAVRDINNEEYQQLMNLTDAPRTVLPLDDKQCEIAIYVNNCRYTTAEVRYTRVYKAVAP